LGESVHPENGGGNYGDVARRSKRRKGALRKMWSEAL
jgi:hypothetical protein